MMRGKIIMEDPLEEVPHMLDSINNSDEKKQFSPAHNRWAPSLKKRLNLDAVGRQKMTSQCSATASSSNSSSNLTSTPNSNQRVMKACLTPVRANRSMTYSEEKSFVDHVCDDDYSRDNDSLPPPEEEGAVRYRRKVRFGKDVSVGSSSAAALSDQSDHFFVPTRNFRGRHNQGRSVMEREDDMGMYAGDYEVEVEEDDSCVDTYQRSGRWSRRARPSEAYGDVSVISDLSQGEMMREVEQAERDIMARSRARNFHIEKVAGKVLVTDLRPKTKQRNRRHHNQSHKKVQSRSPRRSRHRSHYPSQSRNYDQQQPHQDYDSEVNMANNFNRYNFEDQSLESTQGAFDDGFFVPNLGELGEQQHVVHEQVTEDHYVTSSSSNGTGTSISRITRSKTTISLSSGNSSVSSLSQKTGNIKKLTKTEDGLPIVEEEEQANSESFGRWQKTAEALKTSLQQQADQFFASDNWYTLNDDDSDDDRKESTFRRMPFRLPSLRNTARWLKNRRYSSEGPKKAAVRVGRFFSSVFTKKPSQPKSQERKSRFSLFQSSRNESKDMKYHGREFNLEELSMGSTISSDKNQPSFNIKRVSVEMPSKSSLSKYQLEDFDITTDDHPSQEKSPPKKSTPSPKSLEIEEVRTKAETDPVYSIPDPDQPSLALQKHLKSIGVSINSLESIKEGSSSSFNAAPYLSARSKKYSKKSISPPNHTGVNPNRSLRKKQCLQLIKAE